MNLFQTKIEFSDLNTQLKDFGLHPNDWELSPESRRIIKIQNKQQKSFYFIGDIEIQKGKTYWKTIQLAGL